MQWTRDDMLMVTIATIGNGLWLGLLGWLILGLWLGLLSFFTIWGAATLISWPIAIVRQGRAVRMRDELLGAHGRKYESGPST